VDIALKKKKEDIGGERERERERGCGESPVEPILLMSATKA
jgi:hypothetical protein